MNTYTATINTENPVYHWPSHLLKIEGKRVLNLGCGNFGTVENYEYPDDIKYLFTYHPEYVVGVDSNASDIAFLTQQYHSYIVDGTLTLIHAKCDTVLMLQHLIDTSDYCH